MGNDYLKSWWSLFYVSARTLDLVWILAMDHILLRHAELSTISAYTDVSSTLPTLPAPENIPDPMLLPLLLLMFRLLLLLLVFDAKLVRYTELKCKYFYKINKLMLNSYYSSGVGIAIDSYFFPEYLPQYDSTSSMMNSIGYF